MKVLSIDWDYFIDATAGQRAQMFPDGGNENLPSCILDLIWLTRYASNPGMAEIEPRYRELNEVMKYALHFNGPCRASESHKDIYQFIHELGNVDEVVNIDFHHDFYNLGRSLNCGNWGNHLANEGVVVKWVPLEDSDMTNAPDTISFEEAMKQDYGAVFMCRSGVWSPPHLDADFIKLMRAYDCYTALNDRSQCYDRKSIIAYRLICEEASSRK